MVASFFRSDFGKRTLLSASVALVVTGCRTTADIYRDYEANVRRGDYRIQQAELSDKAAEKGNDQLMWQLMYSRLLYLDSANERNIQVLDLAEDTMYARDASPVYSQLGQGATAMIWNDCAFAYDGGGQDRIFTSLYKALSFMALGNVAGARTELNRAAQRQENWLVERQRDIAAAEARLNKDAAKYAKENNANTNETATAAANALADKTFSADIAKGTGYDPSTFDANAIAQSAYWNTYAEHVRKVFRRCVGDEGRKPKDKVWVYVEDGLCPFRSEWRIDLPLFLIPGLNRYVLYAGMALPTLNYRMPGANNYQVSVNGTEFTPMTKLCDVDQLIKTEYDIYMSGALKREITRTIVKAGVQIACGVVAENVSDWKTKTALKGAQLAAAATAAASVKADIRSWNSLPKTVYMAEIDRPASGIVTIWADGEHIPVSVSEGNSLVFVTKPDRYAKPVTRSITLK